MNSFSFEFRPCVMEDKTASAIVSVRVHCGERPWSLSCAEAGERTCLTHRSVCPQVSRLGIRGVTINRTLVVTTANGAPDLPSVGHSQLTSPYWKTRR